MPYQLVIKDDKNSNFNQTHSITTQTTKKKTILTALAKSTKPTRSFKAKQKTICTTWMTR